MSNPCDECIKSMKCVEVSQKQMLITTENSVYWIGPADENGERDIEREVVPLPFTRGKIILLEEGGYMQIIPSGCGGEEPWTTTKVTYVWEAP